MTDKLPTRRKIFDLVGEARENDDGKSRQDVLRWCKPGDPVRLVRQPLNPHDPRAILVTIAAGDGIGYLGRDDAALLAPTLDAGRAHTAIIHELRGGLPDYPNFGCKISIAWDGGRALDPIPLQQAQTLFGHQSSPKTGGCLGIVALLIGVTPLLVTRFLA